VAAENPSLTPTERQVLALAAQGQSSKQIARCLSLHAETVKSHLYSAFAKCAGSGGVRNRTRFAADQAAGSDVAESTGGVGATP
jgi:DNA-binding CsgD family transcriptional regulator